MNYNNNSKIILNGYTILSGNNFVNIETSPEQFSHISWEELLSRPNFQVPFEGEFKLSKVIGMYEAPTSIHCGLVSCNQAHNKGLIIVNDNGMETNVGHVCGIKRFGVDFNKHTNKINANWKVYAQRQKIIDFKNQINEILEPLFKKYFPFEEISRLNKQLSQYVTLGKVSDFAYYSLREIRKTKNPSVRSNVELKEHEIQVIEARKNIVLPRPYSEEREIGKVFHSNVLDSVENDGIQKLFNSLKNTLNLVKSLSDDEINQLTSTRLRGIYTMVNEYSANARKLQEIKVEGYKFLNPDNLKCFN